MNPTKKFVECRSITSSDVVFIALGTNQSLQEMVEWSGVFYATSLMFFNESSTNSESNQRALKNIAFVPIRLLSVIKVMKDQSLSFTDEVEKCLFFRLIFALFLR